MNLIDYLRTEARLAPESGISALADYGRGKERLIPLWVGEGDQTTPAFITNAAVKALQGGETFYTWQRGLPELREALARYHERHFGGPYRSEEFLVTGGGMQAIQLALQATAGAGDEVIYLSPAWPNFPAAAEVAGARAISVPLDLSGNGWTCDVERIENEINGRTKAIFFNSPSNPTGWTADKPTLKAVLDLARRKGLWIISDETYALFHYGGTRAPSFLDVMEAEDRIIFVNTFSKNWAMTGWRIGWLKIHPSLQQAFENLIQYATSGTAQFMQRGAVAALDHGDDFVAGQVERARQARDLICGRLAATGRARFHAPAGAFYLFFAIDGITDSMAAAFRVVDEANVGLAPGAAFGPGVEGFFRLCFHRRLDQVQEAAGRLATWIEKL